MGHGVSLWRPHPPVEGLALYVSSQMGLDIQRGSKRRHSTLPFSFSLGRERCFKVMTIKRKTEIILVLVMRIFFLNYTV